MQALIDKDERLVGILSMNDIALHARSGVTRPQAITFEKVVDTLKAICIRTVIKVDFFLFALLMSFFIFLIIYLYRTFMYGQ